MQGIGKMLGLDPQTQEKLGVDTQKYINKGTKLIHSAQTRESVKEMLKGGNPIESVANAAVGVLKRIDDVSRRSGYEAHDVVKLEAGLDIVKQIAEVGEKSGLTKPFSEEQVMAAYSVAVEKYLKGEIEAGRIDPNKLRDEVGQGLSKMTPEQQREIDKQTVMIGKTAMGETA